MINLGLARQLLHKAVDTQGPDFVYKGNGVTGGCYYEPVDHDFFTPEDARRKTGCLVGVALKLAGETRQDGSMTTVRALARNHPGMMSDDAANYLQLAQSAQDSGSTWGEALERAEEFARAIETVKAGGND